MPYHRDPVEFQRRYSQLGPGQSREFHALRAEFETPAKRLEDYGLSVALMAALLACARPLRRQVIKLRSAPWTAALLGFVASAVTVAAEAAQLFLDAWRGEFPWWADSLGIPLAGLPFVFVALCVWALCNEGLMLWRLRASRKFLKVLRLGVLIATSGVTFFIMGTPIVDGDFLSIPVCLGWTAFYVAIVRCWEAAEATVPTPATG